MTTVSRYERPRFRITTSPSVVAAPSRISAPTLVAGPFMTEDEVLDFIDGNIVVTKDDGTTAPVRAYRSSRADRASANERFSRRFREGGALISDLAGTTAEVPPDLFLRGLLGNLDDLLQMIGQLGPVRVPAGLVEAAAGIGVIPSAADHPEWHWRSVCDEVRGEPGDADLRGEEELIVATSPAAPKGVLLTFHQFSVRQQLFVLRLYRAVTLTALDLSGGSDGVEGQLEDVRATWEQAQLPVPTTVDQALITTSRLLNLATAALGPRMQLIDVDTGEAASGGPSVDLLGVLAAQVLAHVSEGAPVRQCAHAPCGRWFSHQLGRARYGQRRSRGVLYCTDRCARAAAQQRYRQRQRAARSSQPE